MYRDDYTICPSKMTYSLLCQYIGLTKTSDMGEILELLASDWVCNFVCVFLMFRLDVVICLSTTVRNDTLQDAKEQRVSVKCRKQLRVEEVEMVCSLSNHSQLEGVRQLVSPKTQQHRKYSHR